MTTRARRTSRHWTPEEDAVLLDHYERLGPRPVLAKLWAGGWNDRSYQAVVNRAATLGLQAPTTGGGRRVSWPRTVDDEPVGRATGANWRRRLLELAESNPSPAEYERRKRQILKEANQS